MGKRKEEANILSKNCCCELEPVDELMPNR